MSAPTCAHCDKSGTSALPLKKCTGCHNIWYCSRECQRADWRSHKPTCRSTTTGAGNSAATDDTAATGAASEHSVNDAAYRYWNNSAHLDPAARELAEKLKLDFPNGTRGLKSGITYPLRRLTATGHDTPSNNHLLFGTTTPLSGSKSVRKHVLLHPPPGSPASVMYSALDENCPYWTPRPPTEEEQREIEQIRDMQRRIREVVPAGTEVGNEVMKSVLMGMGGGWVEMLPVYEDAVNCLDQGVRVQGV